MTIRYHNTYLSGNNICINLKNMYTFIVSYIKYGNSLYQLLRLISDNMTNNKFLVILLV